MIFLKSAVGWRSSSLVSLTWTGGILLSIFGEVNSFQAVNFWKKIVTGGWEISWFFWSGVLIFWSAWPEEKDWKSGCREISVQKIQDGVCSFSFSGQNNEVPDTRFWWMNEWASETGLGSGSCSFLNWNLLLFKISVDPKRKAPDEPGLL